MSRNSKKGDRDMNKRAVKSHSKSKLSSASKEKRRANKKSAQLIAELNNRYWTDVLWLDRA